MSTSRLQRPSTPRLALFFALVAACGGGGDGEGGAAIPLDRALHLDLRLADGRSPTAALSAGPPAILKRFDGVAAGAWELQQSESHHVLRLAGPVDANQYRWLELQLEGRASKGVSASWKRGDELFQRTFRFQAMTHTGAFAIALDEDPRWSGAIHDLRLRFDPDASLRLLSVKLASSSFTSGFEATSEGLADPSEAEGDMGLVSFGEAARRAWPTELGVPLYARCNAPPGARLRVDVASLVAGDVAVEICARRAGKGDYAVLLSAEQRGPRWQAFSAELGELAGGPLELRFRALRRADAAAESVPRRADVLFGEPLITCARPPGGRPNIVLITLDTLRGDVLGRGFTPNLEAMAARGTRFTQAFATTNSTIPSHASIFTGVTLEEHGAIGNRHAFRAENLALAERLRAAGYRTGAAISVSLLRPGFGFGQGFDRFELPHENGFRDGSLATEVALEWLAEWSSDGAPFFLWLHLFDAHTPYGPPDEFVDAFLEETGMTRPPRTAEPPTMPVWDEPPAQLSFLKGTSNRDHVVFQYHLGAAHADLQVGRLRARLAELGLAEDTLVIATADHGESLGERDYWFEHGNLYPEVLHVPLILEGPSIPTGVTVTADVSHVDLLPTVLAAAGVRGDGLGGLDLAHLARAGEPPAPRPLWFQLSDQRQTGFRDARVHFVATLADGLRWISGSEPDPTGRMVSRFASESAGARHLFDLERDPEALVDVAAVQSERAAQLFADVEAWVASRAKAKVTALELTNDEEATLKDLGYAGE